MSPKSLFNIILKVLGLFFVRDFLTTLPNLLSTVSILINFSGREPISPFLSVLFIVAIYGYVAYVLVFRTDWVIEKLGLAEGFEEEIISFNVQRSTVLSLATIIIGALLIINTLPSLLRQAFLVFQAQKESLLNYYPKPDTTLIIVYVVEVIIGLLLLGNVGNVVSYIELKRRGAR